MPFGPLDGPARDLAHGQLGVIIAEGTADKVVGEHLSISMAPAPQATTR
jgi:hypothetical protein